MVLRRERSGGGRVFAGGRVTLLLVGEDSCLMVDFESSVDGSALMPACSSFSGASCFIPPDSSRKLGLSLNGSSFNGGSRLMETCSSFSDGGRDPGIGIDGVGKSLQAI